MVMTVTTSSGTKVTMYCLGSLTFAPQEAVKDSETHSKVLQSLAETNDFATAIRTWFHLVEDDNSSEAADEYVYHAIASVKLSQVQRAVEMGGNKGMHGWYKLEGGSDLLPPPPQADIESYISIFSPSTATASALTAFQSNAKRSSIRLRSATYLASKRYLATDWHPLGNQLIIPKVKNSATIPCNPYFDFWAWSCRNLEWCGPVPISSSNDEEEDKIILTNPRMSHHILPIFMHHFGCAVPSHESLSLLKLLSRGKPIIDMGSGNGYWTFMLRQYLTSPVYAVDNNQSEWRVMWIDDTVVTDGIKWLRSPPQNGGQDMILLLVYPIVGGDGSAAGGKEGGFTRELLRAYKGDTIAVVGTQNRNGYTGFKGQTMDEYMERDEERRKEGWRKVVQVPLPSFAGKDEALFVFQRGEALVGGRSDGVGEGGAEKKKKKKRKSGKKKTANKNGEDGGGNQEEEGEEPEGGDE
ncbi:hypothetical protein B0T20DRAFT_271286 [Sordaria brevicollis]|uniref:Uncharacterized protein n=1 Tax=Sordaria brevicollis TaxID=83679 RepID=A0AAE0UA03_SORBR|nr:hypothetical protein B0T20DRAFT_271286 [Sordaria brevicollis]